LAQKQRPHRFCHLVFLFARDRALGARSHGAQFAQRRREIKRQSPQPTHS